MTNPLELESGFTRGVGESLHAAVITETRAVECDGLDTGGLRLFSDALADQRGCGGVAALASLAGELGTHFSFDGRCGCQHLRAICRKNLSVDMRIGPMHCQPVHLQLGDLDPGLLCAARTRLLLIHDRHLYFFLVSLRITTSSA